MNQPFNLVATTAFGLEAVVKRELAALGYEARIGDPGRIHFAGDLSAICRTNLWLRTADRVLVQVASFEAADFDALFDTTKSLPWAAWIPKDGQFPVMGRSLKSQLSSVPACQRAVKKAIVESLLAAHGVETLPETGATYKVEIALLNDQATLTIDTTGPSLHKRGYRLQAGEAPLKETLAAAMVQLSFWNRERPFLDPFCGSGTLPIEAALIGRNIAPGIARSFPAEEWPQFEGRLWDEARQEAKDLILPTSIKERSMPRGRTLNERASRSKFISSVDPSTNWQVSESMAASSRTRPTESGSVTSGSGASCMNPFQSSCVRCRRGHTSLSRRIPISSCSFNARPIADANCITAALSVLTINSTARVPTQVTTPYVRWRRCRMRTILQRKFPSRVHGGPRLRLSLAASPTKVASRRNCSAVV
jgi:hypothetical protein